MSENGEYRNRNDVNFIVIFRRITSDNIDVLTEIGILYLRINDTKGAFDKLFEVTKTDENCSKALLALGSILQVRHFNINECFNVINVFAINYSRRMMSTGP